MKTILLSYKGFENNSIFTIENKDDLNGSWKKLKSKLADIGYELKTVDQNDLATAERILFVDEVSLGIKKNPRSRIRSYVKKILGIKNSALPQRETYKEAIALGLKDKMALMLWEPSSVDSDNYTTETFDKFSTILTWNDDFVDNVKFFKFLHPYSGKERPMPNINFNAKKFLVNISINKHSNFPDELYSKRRESIEFFDKKLGDKFDLFGYGWNKPSTRFEKIFPFTAKKYSSYRGTCEDKHSVLSNYKFSLCYENIKNVNGWITEKIFDCFQAKTVPIYWGAENITKYIPKETFIDRRDFKNNQELLDFLNTIDEEKYSKYLTAIQEFMTSEKYQAFLPDNFFSYIVKALKL